MNWQTSFHFPLTRVARAKLVAAVLLLVIPALGLYAGYFLEKEGLAPTVLGRQQKDAGAPRLIGPPVSNRLSAAYSDGDGDLVADPPPFPDQQKNPERLVLAVSPFTVFEDFSTRWQPLLDHLSKATGKRVELEIASPEETHRLAAMRRGEVHLAVLSAGAVPLAVNAAGFVPVAMLPTSNGEGFTRLVLIVPAKSKIVSPFELRDCELLCVEQTSNTGFKAAIVALRDDFGLRPGLDFTWNFSGSAESSIRAIKDNIATAASVPLNVLSDEVAASRIGADDFRVIYESDKFPAAAIGYAHDLNLGLAGKLRRALLSFDWKQTKLEPVLGSRLTRFVPTNYRTDWWTVRRIDDVTGTNHTLGPR